MAHSGVRTPDGRQMLTGAVFTQRVMLRPVAIRSFADERTMRIERGEPVSGISQLLARRIQRLLRIVDAARDLATVSSAPSVQGAILVEGGCTIPVGSDWTVTFSWHAGDAWNVAVEAR
jgi:plasmid maintenance system killer protein